jgi:hypothetical protein
MSNPDPLINLADLARRLRLPRSWLRSEARAGRLPCLHVGRRQYFSLEAIRQCLADRAAMPADRRACSSPSELSSRSATDHSVATSADARALP